MCYINSSFLSLNYCKTKINYCNTNNKNRINVLHKIDKNGQKRPKNWQKLPVRRNSSKSLESHPYFSLTKD